MAQVHTINKLPQDIREEFHQKIIDSNFYSFDELTLWLKDKGCSVSRSSVHRYVTAFKDELINSHNEQATALTYLRLECIKVASSLNKSTDINEIKKDAQSILNWVISSK